MLEQVIEKSRRDNSEKIRERLKEGFIVKHITPYSNEDVIEYILEKDITPVCDYIKLHEATKEQLLEELSKRLDKESE